jgi:hypothetical protein
VPPDILNYNDGPKNGKRLTEPECSEVYNALSDRLNSLKAALLPELPERTRKALEESIVRCEKLVEVFE